MRQNSPAIACIVLPTYNEFENISIIVPAIFQQTKWITRFDLHVLVVDDNSPDGTQQAVRELMTRYPTLHLLTGPKMGLGEAYKKGMQWAIETLNADLIFEMDADLQHDPDLIPVFTTLATHHFDVIIGSRFVAGGRTPNFSLRRKIISRIGNWMIRFLGGVPHIKDCTSGYRCIKSDLLRKCNLSFLSTKGYSFQASLLSELVRNGAQVAEVPITFHERKYGVSKLSLKDMIEFIINVPRIRFNQAHEYVNFYTVGTLGVLVNFGLYVLLTRKLRVPSTLAPLVAIEASILFNFALRHFWLRPNNPADYSWKKAILTFNWLASMAGMIHYIIFIGLMAVFEMGDIIAYLIGIAFGIIINYSINALRVRQNPTKA